jgi:uncharacterized protein
MDNPLDPVGIRVLGALIEKEITTPDNYPLTLNALVAACNQTTNRAPVMSLDEAAVSSSLDGLTGRLLVRQVHRSDSRAKRYRQAMSETMHLHAAETAVMGILMLRGAQTAGEIRARTARLFEFVDVSHVELTLQALMTLSEPLVAQLERRPGQKEVRYAHLLSGEPQVDTPEAEAPLDAEGWAGGADVGAPTETDRDLPTGTDRDKRTGANRDLPSGIDRVDALEQAIDSLRAELVELRERFEEFRREFQ